VSRRVIRVRGAGLTFEEKTDKRRERRTSRDTGVDGLFGAVRSVLRLRGDQIRQTKRRIAPPKS
jgi:hypothetical protein